MTNLLERNRRVTFERATATTDDYGQEVKTWAALESGFAKVRFGSAQEKREAASEGGVQTATFELVPTGALLGVTLRDRIQFDGSAWDISEVAPLDARTIRFTASRSV